MNRSQRNTNKKMWKFFGNINKKIASINDIVKKTDFNRKITDMSNKTVNTTHLPEKVTGIENKIPDANNLIMKTNFNTKIVET